VTLTQPGDEGGHPYCSVVPPFFRAKSGGRPTHFETSRNTAYCLMGSMASFIGT
jgi:hypothetical protein